jgi:putative ABC transport system permease protein
MNWITQLRKRREFSDDLSEEIREHLEEKTNDLIERGMSRAEARAAAMREFGNATLIQERSRETWHWMSLEDFFSDVRYGARSLRKNPGFTLVAVLTLALGIGANSAIFSLVNAVLLRSLPFAEPDRLVSLSEHNWYPQGGFVALRSSSQRMDVAAYLEGRELNLTGEGDPERLYGTNVSAEFFTVLGVRPEQGRGFVRGADQPGNDSVAILSHSLWQNKFQSDPRVIGRHILLGGVSREVVGIMPADFSFGSPKTQIWIPFAFDPRERTFWGTDWTPIIGRLRSGVSIAQANAELQPFQTRLLTMFPWKMPAGTWKYPPSVIPLQQDVVAAVQPKLLILLTAIALVLLIACANVANLLLARAATRQREMAVRATLGAGRWRICRQLLTESTLLGLGGSIVGLALAYFAISWLKSMLPAEEIPRLASVSIDVRVLLFTALIGMVTGVVFGLAPALQLSNVELTESLKTGSKNLVAANHRLRSSLAVTEIALAVVLVTGAGLMVKSLWRLLHVDPGFRSESILSARITPNQAFCKNFQRCQSFYDSLLDRVRALPGVRNAALVNALPLNGRIGFIAARWEGYPEIRDGEVEPLIFDSVVTPDYLSVMQIPLLRGRNFTESDTAPGAEPVALITASTARKYFPGNPAVGKHVRAAWLNEWKRVVGVVADVREDSLAKPLPDYINGAIYEPYTQHAQLIYRQPPTEMTLVVRGSTNAASFAGALHQAVLELNREVPITEVQTLRQVVNDSVSGSRAIMSLFAIFAALAVVLGAVGVYGVLSYSVAQRTSEIGVRMALGAQRADIQALILGQGLRIAILGICAGLAGAIVLTRLMTTLLYGVTATDPATFASVALLLAVIALVACYIPAQRAVRMDPTVALRYE